MPLIVQPVQASDIEAAALVHNASFSATSTVDAIMYPNGFTGGAREGLIKAYRDNFNDAHTTCLKVVDTDHDNRLVAWIDFKTTREELSEDPWMKKLNESSETESPPDVNMEFLNIFFGGLGKLKSKYIGTRPHIHIGLLVTDPAYHRRGSGKMLLTECAQHADSLHLPTILEASPLAAPLYARQGFVLVDGAVSELDLKPWGYDQVHRTVMMERPSQTH